MIALDCQSFSVVDDAGFIRLLKALEPRYVLPSRKYITENVIPKLYDEVKSAVSKHVTGISHISF